MIHHNHHHHQYEAFDNPSEIPDIGRPRRPSFQWSRPVQTPDIYAVSYDVANWDNTHAQESPQHKDTEAGPQQPPVISSQHPGVGADENEERGNWSGRMDFIFSCLGYAVGLGNVWRFPYMCYRNGGGAFLIPYTLFLIFVGMPLFLLDVSLGQFCSSGPLTCWEFAPLLTGIGYGMTIISSLVGVYYMVITAYSIYYFFASMASPLPWSGCSNPWNSIDCRFLLPLVNCSGLDMRRDSDGQCFNATTGVFRGLWNESLFTSSTNRTPVLPAQEYFNNEVLGLTANISQLGPCRWKLVLCLLLAWSIVFLCCMRGIKSSSKVTYFTSLFPYLVLVILFFRGITLDGAGEGIRFYIVPNFTKLREAPVWKDAANQIFFSLSASWGGLITLASYNRFHNNVIRDTIIVSISNCGTSVFAGFAIFSFLGHLAKEMKTDIDKVAEQGIGLAFVIYPEAVNTMPGSTFWSLLFFFMLILLGLDSQFTLVETVVTALLDKFPIHMRRVKTWSTLFFCCLFFLMGLPLTTGGGPYMLQLMDSYCGGWSILLIALIEVLTIGWLYGRPGYNPCSARPMRFLKDIELMIGHPPSVWWRFTWQYSAPLLLAGILIFSLIDYSPARYAHYYYPAWADALGWCMTSSSLLWVPILIVYLVWRDNSPRPLYRKLWSLTQPSYKWGPALSKHRRLVVRYLEDPSEFFIDLQHNIKYSDLLHKEQEQGEQPNVTTTDLVNGGQWNPAFTPAQDVDEVSLGQLTTNGDLAVSNGNNDRFTNSGTSPETSVLSSSTAVLNIQSSPEKKVPGEFTNVNLR